MLLISCYVFPTINCYFFPPLLFLPVTFCPPTSGVTHRSVRAVRAPLSPRPRRPCPVPRGCPPDHCCPADPEAPSRPGPRRSLRDPAPPLGQRGRAGQPAPNRQPLRLAPKLLQCERSTLHTNIASGNEVIIINCIIS